MLDTMSKAGGYREGESNSASIWPRVTTMNTAKTAMRITTIRDWTLAMASAPRIWTAATTMMTPAVNRSPEIALAPSPMNRAVA